MTKRTSLLVFGIAAALNVSAQITIEGHKPFYDQSTQSFLFVTDSLSIKNLTANVTSDSNSSWKDIKIDGNTVNGLYDFGNATNDKTYTLTATAGNGSIERIVRFTCMPVISITKASTFTNDYEQASLLIDSPDGTFADSTLSCQIKHRGGTTNGSDRHKRNYKFKIVDVNGDSKDVSFFGMREDNGWILDAGQVDLFRMRNKINHELWLDFSTKPDYFTEEPKAVNGCHTKEIEVFINNEYRGIYNLMEPVDRKQLKLKKYKSKDGVHGVLYKAESWESTGFFDPATKPYSNKDAYWAGFEAKYPEPGDDADTTDYKPLIDFTNFVASSSDDTFLKEISQRVDLPVYCDYSLMIQLNGGFDNQGKNMYWSVYDKTKSKYSKFVPTPWDMDATFGQFWYNNGTAEDSVWVRPTHDNNTSTAIDYRLVKLDKNYNDYRNQRYAELRKTWFSYDSLVGRFQKAYDEIAFSGAAKREAAKWSGDSDLGGHELNWESQIAYIKSWISKRLEFSDSIYSYSSPTGITAVSTDQNGVVRDQNVYNLQGQKVSPTYRGIVIREGKKYYQK